MAGDFPQRLCDYDRRSDPHMEAGRRSRCPAGGREAVKLPGIEREPVEVEPVEAVELAKLARAGRDFLFIFSSVKVLAENHK